MAKYDEDLMTAVREYLISSGCEKAAKALASETKLVSRREKNVQVWVLLFFWFFFLAGWGVLVWRRGLG